MEQFTPGAGVSIDERQTFPHVLTTTANRFAPRGRGDEASSRPAAAAAEAADVDSTSDGLGVGRGGAVAEIPALRLQEPGPMAFRCRAGNSGWPCRPVPHDPSHRSHDVDGRAYVPDDRLSPTRGRYRGARTHGTCGKPDSQHGRFTKRDTGEWRAILEAIVLPIARPFPHGASVCSNGYIYWVDDIGGGQAPVCRTKI